ncbi:MAG: 2-isopropylmalate synthase [Longimicrobiales bacterium]
MNRVAVFDTTLRDGEQSPGASMTPQEKLRMAHQLDALGVDVLEAGFPISSPADADAVRAIASEVRRPVIAALARAHPRDIDEAGVALEAAERGRIHVFIATSDVHLNRKLRICRDECVERAVAAVERARQFTNDVEFSAEDATRTDVPFLCRVVDAAIAAGARTVNLPDTVGYSYPAEYRALFETVRAAVPKTSDVVLSAHCHDDLGLAVANSLAAIEGGARQVECTVNGIGERAGNAALEEVVMALRARRDAFPYETAVSTQEIARSSHLLAYLTGLYPQPNKAIVGKNAFAHEAGIHQDGMLKERTTYEIMTPQSVGVRDTHLVLGKHSGRNALSQRYRVLGYELDEDELTRAYQLFKLLADQKKMILDEDLIAILNHGTMDDVPAHYGLRALHVQCGSDPAIAKVCLAIGQVEREALAQGDGPVAAAFAAIDALVDCRTELVELKLHSVTPGSDALGEVSLIVKVNGQTFTGRGASPDIVNAAACGYLHALNKAAQARELEAVALERASYLWGV